MSPSPKTCIICDDFLTEHDLKILLGYLEGEPVYNNKCSDCRTIIAQGMMKK